MKGASILPLDITNQISLESINLTLRLGEPLTFSFSVKPAENFPLDLYILMDLSNSFRDDLIQVKKLAPSLANSLSNLTDDSLIGFGTFTDKRTPPFTSNKQLDLGWTYNGMPSCQETRECSLPIAFEHVSDLTNSSEEFNSTIQGVILSTSADAPEGTLDAMMQAVVCNKVIGWRDKSRKVLLVMTDAVVHSAGDGKLAGIVRQNDELCHTMYDPEHDKIHYISSAEYDYPSLEQLRLVMRRNSIVPVFAVTTDIQDYFQLIKDRLNSFITTIAEDSSNLLSVIEEAYNDIISRVSLDYDSPEFLDTSLSFKCPTGQNGSSFRDDECDDIDGEEVQINMTITLTSCSSDVSGGNVYPLEVTVLGFGRFTVNIQGECECDCDKENTVNESRCVNGDLRCGRCYCDDLWNGSRCDCSRNPCPIFNGRECNGRGRCDGCGSCVCDNIASPQNNINNPIILGDACECSNFECETNSAGLVCSGRGSCECDINGVHSCNCSVSTLTGERHSGDVCQCSTDHCINPRNITSGMCSGHGQCEICATQPCICDDNYLGEYCQSFFDSIINNCGSADEGCVKCYGEAAEEKNAGSSCNATCVNYEAVFSSQPSNYQIPGTINDSTRECSISTTECTYIYYVGTTLSSELIYIVEPRDCLLIPIWAIAVIIVVALLIIGVIILGVIKLCIMWQDYREYKTFMYEVNKSDKMLQSNPVYQDPITHVDNPLHEKAIKNQLES